MYTTRSYQILVTTWNLKKKNHQQSEIKLLSQKQVYSKTELSSLICSETFFKILLISQCNTPVYINSYPHLRLILTLTKHLRNAVFLYFTLVLLSSGLFMFPNQKDYASRALHFMK